MASYTDKLATLTADVFKDMKNPFYSTLSPLVTQDVLHDAYEMAHAFKKAYDQDRMGEVCLEVRKEKSLDRVLKKLERNSPDIHFKANSDFIAFRLNCDIHELRQEVADHMEYVTRKGGIVFERNLIISENTGKLTDIVTICFAYIPQYKYIMEFQIGHPFASYVFARDSAIRDGKGDYVDLWENNFYNKVKAQLLGTARYDLVQELNTLYESHPLLGQEYDKMCTSPNDNYPRPRPVEPELMKIIENVVEYTTYAYHEV